jgi:hypothetical protein
MALAYYSRMPGVVVPGCPLPKLSGSPADRQIPLLGLFIPLLGSVRNFALESVESTTCRVAFDLRGAAMGIFRCFFR